MQPASYKVTQPRWFADAEFDIVWGQDARCHVDDKAALIAECARVLKHNGRKSSRTGSRLARRTLRQLRCAGRGGSPTWCPSSVISPYCKTMVL